MSKLNTALRGVQIADAVAGDGLQWDGSDNLAIDISDFIDTSYGLVADGENIRVNITADIGLHFNAGALEIELDGSTLAVGADGIKLANLTAAYVLVGNVSNVATGVAISGDITLANDGTVAIASGVIIDADVKSDAAIAYSKLANLTAAHILVGSAGAVATDVAVSGDVTMGNDGATTVTDLTITNEADGDLIYFDGSNWVRVAKTETNDYVLTQQTNGDLSWTAKSSVAEDYIQEAEIQKTVGYGTGAVTVFSIGDAAVANSVQVFYEGSLVEEGSGKDYTLAGTDVTFVTAPEDGVIIQIHSIKT